MREDPIADAGDVVRRTRHGKLSFVAVSALGVVERNAVHVSDFFSLPSDQVVEIGRLVAI